MQIAHPTPPNPPIDRRPFTVALRRLTLQDWQELADYLRRLHAYHGPYYETFRGAHYLSAPIVEELHTMLYDKGLIVHFAWNRWDEGRAIASSERPDRYDAITPEEAVMLFTAVVRNSRFCEGAFDVFVERGDAVMLLEKLLTARPEESPAMDERR